MNDGFPLLPPGMEDYDNHTNDGTGFYVISGRPLKFPPFHRSPCILFPLIGNTIYKQLFLRYDRKKPQMPVARNIVVDTDSRNIRQAKSHTDRKKIK